MSEDSSFVEIGGNTSGLIDALSAGAEALVSFAQLSEQQVARINQVFQTIGQARGGIQSILDGLAEIDRAVGFDTLLSTLRLVDAGLDETISRVQALSAAMSSVRLQQLNVSSSDSPYRPIGQIAGQGALTAGATGTNLVPTSQGLFGDYISRYQVSINESVLSQQRAAAAADLLAQAQQAVAVAYLRQVALLSGRQAPVQYAQLDSAQVRLGGQAALPAGSGGSNLVPLGGGGGAYGPIFQGGQGTEQTDAFFTGLGTASQGLRDLYEAQQQEVLVTTQLNETLREQAILAEQANTADGQRAGRLGGRGNSGGKGGGGAGGAAAADESGASSSNAGFFSLFAKGFGGGEGKDANPFAEQLGTITKYTLFYGVAYDALFKFTSGIGQAIAQMEAFQQATITLAQVMDTTTAEATDVATGLGNIAAAAGVSPDQGVVVGTRAIGLYGLTGAGSDAQIAAAQNSVSVTSQAAFNTGQPITPELLTTIQNQIAATAQGFGLGQGSQQSISDVDTYLSRRYGQAPGSTLGATSQIAGTASAVGFSETQLAAAVAYLEARTGDSAQTVAGYLQQILAHSTNAATETAIRGTGVNTQQDFFSQLTALSEKNLTPQQLDSLLTAFGRGKVGNAAQLLIGGFGGVNQSASLAVTNAPGSATEEANRQLDTLRGTLVLLHTETLNLLKDLGDSGLLDVLGGLARVALAVVGDITPFVQEFDRLDSGVKSAISVIGILSAAILLLGHNAEAAAAKVAEGGSGGLIDQVLGKAGLARTGVSAAAGATVAGAVGAAGATDVAAAQAALKAADLNVANAKKLIAIAEETASEEALAAANIKLIAAQRDRTVAVQGVGNALAGNVGKTAAVGEGAVAGAAAGAVEGDVAATAEKTIGARLLSLGSVLTAGVLSLSKFFTSGTGVALLAVGELAFAESVYRAGSAINKANDKLESFNADAQGVSGAQSSASALQTAIDSQRKASGSIVGRVAQGTVSASIGIDSFFGAIGDGRAVSDQEKAQRALANAADANAPLQEAALTNYAAQQAKLDAAATNSGTGDALNLTSVTTLSASFTELEKSGADAGTEMQALVDSLNSLGVAADGSKKALSVYQIQSTGLAASGNLANDLVGQANDNGISLKGFDITGAQDKLSALVSGTLTQDGGKLTKDQTQQLVSLGQQTIDQLIPGFAGKKKSAQDALNSGISLAIQSAVHASLNANGTVNSSDPTVVEAAIKEGLTTVGAAGSEAQNNYLQYDPGNTTGAAAASTNAQIQYLQNLKTAAQGALKGASGEDAQALKTQLQTLNDKIVELENGALQNAIASIQAFSALNVASISQYDKAGQIAAQLTSDTIVSNLAPGDPAAQAKVLQDKVNAANNAQADQAAKITDSVRTGDVVGAAGATLTNAVAALDAITATGVRSGKAYTDAAKAVADDKVAYAVAQAGQVADIAALNVDPQDQLAATHGQITALIAKIRAEGSASQQAIVDQAQLNQLLVQQSQQQIAANAVARGLGGDSTNPAQVAARALQTAQEQLQADQKTVGRPGGADQNTINKDTASVRTASDSAQSAAFTQQINDYQTQEQLGQISEQAYLNYLEAEHSTLQTKLKAMNANTDGYRQAQDELNQVDQAIKAAAGSLDSKFNLGNITLPTPYEIRRYIAGDTSGGTSAAGATQVNINISGADTGKIQQVLGQYLGPAVVDSYSSITRKVGA